MDLSQQRVAVCHRCPERQRPCAGACACTADAARRDIIDHARAGECPRGYFSGEPIPPPPPVAASGSAGGCCDPPKLNEPLPPAVNADPVNPAARAEQAGILKLPPEQRPRTPE